MNIELPEKINLAAKEYLNNMINKLTEAGVIEDVDSEAIRMLAYNLSAFYDASDHLCAEGYTVLSDRGNVSPSPWVKIQKDAQASAMRLMKDFGLTLASREKINKLSAVTDDGSPLDSFIRGNKEIR